MSVAAPEPVPSQVVYSERVRQRLLALTDVARERGDGEAFLAALKEFHRRLGRYPQFGEPLIDLTRELGQVWLGIVRPPAMRYGVFDEKRIVVVTELLVLLPKSGQTVGHSGLGVSLFFRTFLRANPTRSGNEVVSGDG